MGTGKNPEEKEELKEQSQKEMEPAGIQAGEVPVTVQTRAVFASIVC